MQTFFQALRGLTDTCRNLHTPPLVVLTGRCLLALQTESGGAEKLTAGVEVRAV